MMRTSTTSLPLSTCNTCSAVSCLRLCACGQVAYCSKSCQQKDWTKHKQDCPRVVLKEIMGKGKGLVAIRNISAGTIIFTEEPLVAFKKENGSTNLPYQKFLQFKKMHPDKFQDFMELYDSDQMDPTWKTDYPDSDYIKFCRIVTANGVGNDDDDMNGIYRQFSRINHSCLPNVSVEWEKLKMEVKAIRVIKKGEELSFNYAGELGIEGSWKERRDLLQKSWFFDCECPACSLTGKERERNDQTRKDIVCQMEKFLERRETFLRKPNSKAYLSTVWPDLLETLAKCYEIQDIFELPVVLCHCHMTYQLVKIAGIKWSLPSGVMRTLTDKLGENFLDVLDEKAMDATVVMDRSKKEMVRQMLEQFRTHFSS